MFAPGRMAYVVDLEDDFPESDIPTTAIRSKVSYILTTASRSKVSSVSTTDIRSKVSYI